MLHLKRFVWTAALCCLISTGSITAWERARPGYLDPFGHWKITQQTPPPLTAPEPRQLRFVEGTLFDGGIDALRQSSRSTLSVNALDCPSDKCFASVVVGYSLPDQVENTDLTLSMFAPGSTRVAVALLNYETGLFELFDEFTVVPIARRLTTRRLEGLITGRPEHRKNGMTEILLSFGWQKGAQHFNPFEGTDGVTLTSAVLEPD